MVLRTAYIDIRNDVVTYMTESLPWHRAAKVCDRFDPTRTAYAQYANLGGFGNIVWMDDTDTPTGDFWKLDYYCANDGFVFTEEERQDLYDSVRCIFL